jgi:hypothetical protein
MAMTIMRPVSIYRLFVDAELLQCMRDHATNGVVPNLFPLANLGALPEAGEPPADALAIRFNTAPTVVAAAGPCADRVVISDFTSIQIVTTAEYAAAFPDNPLPED